MIVEYTKRYMHIINCIPIIFLYFGCAAAFNTRRSEIFLESRSGDHLLTQIEYENTTVIASTPYVIRFPDKRARRYPLRITFPELPGKDPMDLSRKIHYAFYGNFMLGALMPFGYSFDYYLGSMWYRGGRVEISDKEDGPAYSYEDAPMNGDVSRLFAVTSGVTAFILFINGAFGECFPDKPFESGRSCERVERLMFLSSFGFGGLSVYLALDGADRDSVYEEWRNERLLRMKDQNGAPSSVQIRYSTSY